MTCFEQLKGIYRSRISYVYVDIKIYIYICVCACMYVDVYVHIFININKNININKCVQFNYHMYMFSIYDDNYFLSRYKRKHLTVQVNFVRMVRECDIGMLWPRFLESLHR